MITAAKLIVMIITAKREPPYIHQTTASLFDSDASIRRLRPIRLIADSNNPDWLGKYRGDERIILCRLCEQDEAASASWTARHRLNRNFYRCFIEVQKIDDCDALVICEDDVVFRRGFLGKLLNALLEAHDRCPGYILSLYSPYDLDKEPAKWRGPLIRTYDPLFFGTQGVAFSKGIIPEIADYFHALGVEQYTEPADLLIRRFASARNNLYATNRALVQHIGLATTGIDSLFHSAPTFDRPFSME